MPNFTPASISNAKSLITNINTWVNSIDFYISTAVGDYRAVRQAASVIIQGNNIGANCGISNKVDILGNPGLFNMSFDILAELNSVNSFIKPSMTEAEVSRVNSAFSAFASWGKNVISFLSKPIPCVNLETGGLAYDDNGVCGINASQSFITDGNNLVNSSQNVLDGITSPTSTDIIPDPPDTIMYPISVPENSAGKMLEFMQKIYDKTNNDDYVIITRVNQIKAITSDLKEGIQVNLAAIKAETKNTLDARTELKEARQGIKDLLGLGDKFYEGSISTIELLDRINEIHQSENDALYEIRVRTNEIRDNIPITQESLDEIKSRLDNLQTQIRENFTQTNQYISTIVSASENNVAKLIQQVRDEMYTYTVDIIQRINAIDTSVGQ